MDLPRDIPIAFERTATPIELEISVNFGLLTGRAPTLAELDELARELLPLVGELAIVAEERCEYSQHSEGVVQRVRIELDEEHAPWDAPLRAEITRRAASWAAAHAEGLSLNGVD